MSIIVLGFAAWTRHFFSACSHEVFECVHWRFGITNHCDISVCFSCNNPAGWRWKSSVWWIPVLFGYVLLCPTHTCSVPRFWAMSLSTPGLWMSRGRTFPCLIHNLHTSFPLPSEDNPKEIITSSEHSQNKWGARTCWAEIQEKKKIPSYCCRHPWIAVSGMCSLSLRVQIGRGTGMGCEDGDQREKKKKPSMYRVGEQRRALLWKRDD